MNYYTISDLVAGHLEGSLVTAAFFSTYSFESDFFELEIMPLLMAQQVGNSTKIYQPALSTNDAIRWQQLERLMAERQIATSVVYDPGVYQCERSPRLEIAYHGYSPRNGCQHAKLIAMVLEGPKADNAEPSIPQILFGAGSFNLTRAGWWDNIECGHFVRLSEQWAPENLCEAITNALAFYLAQVGGNDTALQKVLDAITQLPKTASDEQLAFYFSGQSNNQRKSTFSKFIAQHSQYSEQLEVISPYFAESGDNKVISQFIERFDNCRILLPTDPRDTTRAKVDQSVYHELMNQGASWCHWQPDVEKNLKESLKENSSQRELHAKVYRMTGSTGSKGADLFMGSVNFSYKAFQDNIEAGFLVKEVGGASLLTDSLKTEPDFFEAAKDELHGGLAEGTGCLPVLNLCYCWKNQTLILVNDEVEWPCEIELFGSANEMLAILISVNGKLQSEVKVENLSELEKHFKNSSLLTARSFHDGEQNRSEILVSQVNICVRPSILPPLRLADLLSIFRGMSKPQLLLLTERYAKLSELQLAYQSGDDLGAELKAASSNFFSEFSEINSAFYHLNEKLIQAKNEDDQRVLDYYIYGKQSDSLYGVFQLIAGKKDEESESNREQIEPVIYYLTLLSIQDTLQRVGSDNGELLDNVCTAINELEGSDALTLTDDTNPEYRQQFFDWFKREFFNSAQPK